MLPWGGNDLMQQPAFVFQAIERCEATWQQLQGDEAREAKAKIEQLNEVKR